MPEWSVALDLINEAFTTLKLLPGLLVSLPVKAKASAKLLFIVPLLNVTAAPDMGLPKDNEPLLTVKILDNTVAPLSVKVPKKNRNITHIRYSTRQSSRCKRGDSRRS